MSRFNIAIDDLKQFRQWNSVIPGHPEYKVTLGVDASSGPLGQSVPIAIGVALAEKLMSKSYPSLINHYTYALCGDDDMQEGVTQEAAQLAGLWELGKLIVLYDSNEVTLDGKLEDSNKEDAKKRFEAMGWQVLEVADGEDLEDIQERLDEVKAEAGKPSLIIVHTIIGYGSKNQGTSKTHGSLWARKMVTMQKKSTDLKATSLTSLLKYIKTLQRTKSKEEMIHIRNDVKS